MSVYIINEKPSVSREFAKALHVTASDSKKGFIDGYSNVLNDNVVITWAVGHLVTLSYPQEYDEKYGKWNMEDLPFLPDEYKYETIADVRKQFNVIRDQLQEASRNPINTVYYAGDSAREGIYIQALIRQQCRCNFKCSEKVVWIDSQTESEIVRGIKEAKDISEYSKLIDAAYTRAIEDYAVGINFSRMLSIKYGKNFNAATKSKKYKPIAVGRVMTCVLGMIVRREMEIKDFKKQEFYKITANCGSDQKFAARWHVTKSSPLFESLKLYGDSGFLSKADADSFIDFLNRKQQLIIQSVERKTEKAQAPALFNLAELQGECTKRFHISPAETLEVIQKLYEAKLLTYPRSDARVLTTAVAKEINKNLSGLAEAGNKIAADILSKGADRSIIGNKRYVDDSKVSDHYAIIPTGEGNAPVSGINADVYNLVLSRFLAIFYPPAEYLKTSVIMHHPDGEEFKASSRELQNPGYLAVYRNDSDDDDEEDKDPAIPTDLKKGDTVPAVFGSRMGETKPPKRYTSGSMVLAMENAGKLIEDEELRAQIKTSGIGTSATRAEIIEKLVKLEYISLDKKKQELTPLAGGVFIYQVVKKIMPEFLSPANTADWEKSLSKIEKGEFSGKECLKQMEDYIRDNYLKIVNAPAMKAPEGAKDNQSSETIAKCPVCGNDVVDGRYGPYCKGKCGMSFKYYGKAFSPKQIKTLCNNGTLHLSARSKDGKAYKFTLSPTGIEDYSYTSSNGKTYSGKQWVFEREFENKDDD